MLIWQRLVLRRDLTIYNCLSSVILDPVLQRESPNSELFLGRFFFLIVNRYSGFLQQILRQTGHQILQGKSLEYS